jgi:DNA-binding NtrC family response regulator
MGQSIQKHRPIAIVVEQDQEQRAMAAVLLEETELDVIECCTAEEALETMDNPTANDHIAMAFVNMRLPGRMDGVEFAQIVKRERPEVQVVVTSRNPGRRFDDLPEGAVHMAKPWLPLELLILAERARADRLSR